MALAGRQDDRGRRVAGRLVPLVLGVLLASCGQPSGPAFDNSGEGNTTNLTIAVGDPALNPTTSFYTSVPDALGYFEEEGLTVTVQQVQDAVAASTLIRAGQAHTAQVGSSALFSFSGPDDDDLVAVALNSGHSFRVVVPDDSPVRTPADLKGRVIGSTSLASAPYFYGRAVVAEAGLDPDSDVEWLPIGSGNQAAAAFEAEDAEAYAGNDSYNAVLGRLLGKRMRVVAAPSDKLPAMGGLVFRRAFVKQEPEVVEGFMRAYFKALTFTLENPEAAIRIHWEKFPQTKPKDLPEDVALEQWRKTLTERLTLSFADKGPDGSWGTAALEDIRRSLTFQHEYGLIKEPVDDVQSVIDFSMNEKASDFDEAAIQEEARTWTPS